MIFKCLECDILKFRKPLSEFLVASENKIPKIRNRFAIFRTLFSQYRKLTITFYEC